MTVRARLRRAFDPSGRLSAGAYRHRVIRLLLCGAVLLCLGIWLASLGARALALLAVAGLPVVGLAFLAATARRLHDRDRSAGWLAAWSLVQALGFAPLDRLADTDPVPVVLVLIAMLGFSAWFVVETLLRRGTPGFNRFGPPDLCVRRTRRSVSHARSRHRPR